MSTKKGASKYYVANSPLHLSKELTTELEAKSHEPKTCYVCFEPITKTRFRPVDVVLQRPKYAASDPLPGVRLAISGPEVAAIIETASGQLHEPVPVCLHCVAAILTHALLSDDKKPLAPWIAQC